MSDTIKTPAKSAAKPAAKPAKPELLIFDDVDRGVGTYKNLSDFSIEELRRVFAKVPKTAKAERINRVVKTTGEIKIYFLGENEMGERAEGVVAFLLS
jgi:hypothetical protein